MISSRSTKRVVGSINGSSQQHLYRQRRPPQVTTLTNPARSIARDVSPSKQPHRFGNTIYSVMEKKSITTFSILFLAALSFNGVVWLVTNYYPYSIMETLGISAPETLAIISVQSHPQLDDDSSSNDRHPRNTKIPHTLIFTHYVNLLTTNFDLIEKERRSNSNTNQNGIRQRYTDEELNELRILQQNVHRIIALHTVDDTRTDNVYPTDSNNHISNNDNKNITVRFLTDDDCIQSIRQWAYLSSRRNHTDILHQINAPNIDPEHNPEDIANELLSYFHQESTGMYKSDLCRGVALYETGGIYLDVDIGPRMNIFNVLLESSEFVTSKVYSESRYPGAFFQAFIAVAMQHDVIHRYIQLFILYYRGTIQIGYGPLGVLLLKRAYDEVQLEQEQRNNENEMLPSTKSYSTPTVLTHLQQTTELWQEILYKPKYHDTIFAHVPIPTWGTVQACKYVVVIPPSQRQLINGNITITSKLIVPLYSRIAGSRRCPNK
jgi:Glycosyltransferase sugar-binding region containing DXD motif